MKENKYGENTFFQKYGEMSRSQKGLAGAGEWKTLKKLLPDFKEKKVLDLGCGYGWHCIYAMENGASSVIGVDISNKMLEVAREKTDFPQVEYRCCAIEDVNFPLDNYYYEGKRTTTFLGEQITKYHRTLTTYLSILLANGFRINHVVEPKPPEEMMDIPGMKDEMRRPMMLIISASKN